MIAANARTIRRILSQCYLRRDLRFPISPSFLQSYPLRHSKYTGPFYNMRTQPDTQFFFNLRWRGAQIFLMTQSVVHWVLKSRDWPYPQYFLRRFRKSHLKCSATQFFAFFRCFKIALDDFCSTLSSKKLTQFFYHSLVVGKSMLFLSTPEYFSLLFDKFIFQRVGSLIWYLHIDKSGLEKGLGREAEQIYRKECIS